MQTDHQQIMPGPQATKVKCLNAIRMGNRLTQTQWRSTSEAYGQIPRAKYTQTPGQV